MKDTLELVFIIDQSGSMRGLEKDTIGGFNSILDKQKDKHGSDVIVSTVLFSHKISIKKDTYLGDVIISFNYMNKDKEKRSF